MNVSEFKTKTHHSVFRVAVLLANGMALSALGDEPAVDEQSEAVRFQEHLIRDGYGYAYGITAADLDGDGDLDLTSSDTDRDKLLWFENDGRGKFTEWLIQKDDPG